MTTLLRTNAKLAKNAGKASRYLIAGLTLAPNRLSGFDVCPWATPGCIGSCNLWFSGQRVTPVARARAIADTKALFADREAFCDRLRCDIVRHVRLAEKASPSLIPLVRLNVASDLDWRDVIEEFPNVEFYDYTKSADRMRDYLAGKLPANYHVTYSVSERSNPRTVASFLRRGGNVAVVFAVDYYPAVGRIGKLPKTWTIGKHAAKVVDGDKHDVRLPAVDGRGVVVGLRLKGTNKAKARARHQRFALPVLSDKGGSQ